jgi:hypothetical protein
MWQRVTPQRLHCVSASDGRRIVCSVSAYSGSTRPRTPSSQRHSTPASKSRGSRPRRGFNYLTLRRTTGSGCRVTADASWSGSRRSTRRSLVEELCRTQSRLCRGLGGRREKLGKTRCERGDLNPKHLVEILRIFTGRTATNRHLPPPSVSGGHIRSSVGDKGSRLAPLAGP